MISESNNIWIDLDNSPHVPFFAPIISELENRGYRVTLTARDCFQVCGMADLYFYRYLRIGRHYGRKKLLKVLGTIYRSFQLTRSVSRVKPSLALSHGSRSQLIASKILGIQSAVIFDYEYTKGFPFLNPDVLIIPELILDGIQSHSSSIFAYPGIKEDVYVPDFVPDPEIIEKLGINGGSLLITIRPPATEAHYHNPESETLFSEVVDFFGTMDNVQMVVLPRNEKKQGDLVKSKWAAWCAARKIIIPEHVVNGLNLIWHSDLVVSGGGTMNREAAALGVPVYSIFRGKIGAVDRYLEKTGRLTLIEKPEDVRAMIKVTHRNKPKETVHKGRESLNRIIDVIEQLVHTK
jgi:predicted glycosyltransferase